MPGQAFQTCRACGKTGLIWGVIRGSGKFYLYNQDGTIHDCPVKPLPNLKELQKIPVE